METKGKEGKRKRQASSHSIPDRVGQIYYAFGLYISNHPFLVIGLALLVTLLACYPLMKLPLPGRFPKTVTMSVEDFEDFYKALVENKTSTDVETWDVPWLKSPPLAYIQQVVIKASVSPWTDEMILTDAFRGPLAAAFQLTELVSNFQSPNGKTLSEYCTHVEEPLHYLPSNISVLFPHYNCLLLSPANIWKKAQHLFLQDSDFLHSIHRLQARKLLEITKDSSSSLTELFFGVPIKESGLKRFLSQSRQRVITYAVTLAVSRYDAGFLGSLDQRLKEQFQRQNSSKEVLHVFYPTQVTFMEVLPILATLVAIFSYMSFSVYKMELLKSKFVMAFSAVLTVIASLCVSLGVCSLLGLSFHWTGKEVLPYLVLVIGLENTLVLTRSVVSTPSSLDVKIRVAQGLSKEGWSITKNLLAEMTILTVGFLTFIPSMQEFCLFAFVAIVSDFFLQLTFFATILSIDIRRLDLDEASTLPRHKVQQGQHHRTYSRSSSIGGGGHYPSYVVAASYGAPFVVHLPRRLRLVYFWAQVRFFQRCFLVFMIIWLSFIIYQVGILSSLAFLAIPTNGSSTPHSQSHLSQKTSSIHPNAKLSGRNASTSEDMRLMHRDLRIHVQLPPSHWPTLFGIYNMSLWGQYITILPPILLSLSVDPEDVKRWRHPQDVDASDKLHKRGFAPAALDSFDSSDGELGPQLRHLVAPSGGQGGPFVPQSPLETTLFIILAIPSVVFTAYLTLVLYRCVCTRHYAEWRSSWDQKEEQEDTEIIMESIPMVLNGHSQEVECVGVGGSYLASASLDGTINLWDVEKGTCQITIHRPSCSSMQTPKSSHSSTDFRKVDEEIQGQWKSSVHTHRRNLSAGSIFLSDSQRSEPDQSCSSSCIWSMSCTRNLLAVGTSSGSIEIYEVGSGQPRCLCEGSLGDGVMGVHLSGGNVIAAHLSGTLRFYALRPSPSQTYPSSRTPLPKGHTRSSSAGSMAVLLPSSGTATGNLTLIEVKSIQAHQQPIIVSECKGGLLITGGQDHLIKVFSVEKSEAMYTLHGHYGPITAIFMDVSTSPLAGSASQDGTLCLWDLSLGSCMYSIQAHDGCVCSLTHTSSYVISMGTDDTVCIWERLLGHLLHVLKLDSSYASCMLMLSSSLLVTSKQGSLVIWDVRVGEPVRILRLGDADESTRVKQLLLVDDHHIVCDYGNQLKVIRFPLVLKYKDD
ncbi:unnamed protein product [Darwinula stevensoni]|uniref:Sterol regulatory element-binding protein cleavage-activating protein n=1 Tax=Darwinula stevensoni TaxID=69355 RepID=A0A7R9A9C2_9CRUS|nr:unnamed protein product [Darwinula stevensoni]CAG0897071.1 unnamed protein product [Darwinula stevensoni]